MASFGGLNTIPWSERVPAPCESPCFRCAKHLVMLGISWHRVNIWKQWGTIFVYHNWRAQKKAIFPDHTKRRARAAFSITNGESLPSITQAYFLFSSGTAHRGWLAHGRRNKGHCSTNSSSHWAPFSTALTAFPYCNRFWTTTRNSHT